MTREQIEEDGGFPAPCGPASLKPQEGLSQGSKLSLGFPAPCGPASLKRGDHARPVLGAADGFPAPCGPASLKPARSSASRTPCSLRFSGPLRAGLIEAAVGLSGSSFVTRFSGPLRAGLIEAPAAPDGAGPGSSGFPAPCGPASLKPLLSHLDHLPVGGFPAPCGPASWKRVARNVAGPALRGFPAPCGPASLKLPVGIGEGRPHRGVFRPLAGRPH